MVFSIRELETRSTQLSSDDLLPPINMMIFGYFIVTVVLLKQSPLPDCTGTALHRSSLCFREYCFLFGGEVCMVYRLAKRFTLEAAVRNVLTSFVSLL